MKKRFIPTLLTLGVASFAATTLAGCSFGTKMVDYVHTAKDVRLRMDYKGRDFYQDGIAKVSVVNYIDGDTTHFEQENGTGFTIKSRYYGIDTPESTGQVENWGASAKKFTNEKLQEAKTIVVSSTNIDTYLPPEVDTNGRALSLIWISDKENADYKDLVLLNLWIVQEGYSYVKSLDKFPEFVDTFREAEAQARALKLHLFSGEKEEGFNDGEYLTTSLMDIKNEVVATINDPTHENAYDNVRVRIQGTVVGYTNGILYLQSGYENEETGEIEYAGINIFCGTGSIPTKYSKVNTYLELCALAQDSETFGFQLTSVYGFPKTKSDDPNDTKIIYTAENNVLPEYQATNFEFDNISELKSGQQDMLFEPVVVKNEFTVTDGYTSNSSPATVTLYTDGGPSIFIPFKYAPDPEDDVTRWNDFELFKNHTFKVSGMYSFRISRSESHAGEVFYQIILRNSEDLILIK